MLRHCPRCHITKHPDRFDGEVCKVCRAELALRLWPVVMWPKDDDGDE